MSKELGPDINEYNCFLSTDRRVLNCGGPVLASKSEDFSGLQMDLDQNGNIIRLRGRVVRQNSWFFGLMKSTEVLSDIDCEIDYSEYQTPDPFNNVVAPNNTVNNSDRSIIIDKPKPHVPPLFKETGSAGATRQ